jgi:hypothetical protein
MASINDFKLVNVKSKKYFDLFAKVFDNDFIDLDEIKKIRFGFYFFMLENITDKRDLFDIVDLITDTEFNSHVFNDKSEDYGIDAIFINEDDFTINLFNFKFREKFNKDKTQSINETLISTKFISALINEDVDHLETKLKKFASDIIFKLNSKDVWKLKLFVVSNETIELNKDDSSLQQLEKLYDLEAIPIGLNNIKELMSIRPEPVNSCLILDKDAIMSFSESSISSSKSYIIRLSLSELIRITCNDAKLRMQYNIEDLKPLSNTELDFSVLFDNVRGFVQNSKYNDNIEKTLSKNPTKFFMYNNGLTITADDINAEEVNAGKKVKLSIINFQVLNGGQSLRTIHNFNNKFNDQITKNLSDSEVLIRVFKTTSDKTLINKIAEYTNSQNAISSIDLKSLSSEQIELEQYLDANKIIYARKTGDTGISESTEYEYKISMERFGQILFSIKGYPEKASNQKKDIFDKYYDDIFGNDNLDIAESPNQVRRYFEIKNTYDNNTLGYISSDQKIFYILFIDKYLSISIEEKIAFFEKIIVEFEPDSKKQIADSRKLIQLKFKEYLLEKLEIK